MESRKAAIVDALLAKADVLLDAHLAISTQEVPDIYRSGFRLSQISKDEELVGELLKNQSVGDFQVVEEEAIKTSNEIQKDGTSELENKGCVEGIEFPVKPEGGVTNLTSRPRSVVKVTLQDIDDSYYELLKWVEPTDSKVLIISSKQAVAHAHYGRALKFLRKAAEDKVYLNNPNIDRAITELVDQLGWVHISSLLRNHMILKYHGQFRLF
ncbi:hypothetical protein AB6A40_004158 [Gnathostoma spinigerum]|uniref:Uncharacterized protein n=1 Tax=Gnathostoma spinigerum TaxID=75299 RepID=A0ABD6EJC8_9BILA